MSASPIASTDASTSASELLSEDEQVMLVHAGEYLDDQIEAVERIVAAREAKARAEAGEQIAQAIEAVEPVEWAIAGMNAGDDAASIAREVTR